MTKSFKDNTIEKPTMDISKIARVALPTIENVVDVDADISEDELEEGHIEEDSDFLADFPDNTEVCN